MEEEKTEKKYLKIGKRYEVRDHYTFERGYVPEWDLIGDGAGVCFKDEEIFFNEPDEVCYVPEAAFVDGFEDLKPVFLATADETPGPWGWTANMFREECKKFLVSHPKFQLDVDEFAHRLFLETTRVVDTSMEVDPLTSIVSIMEVAQKLQKEKHTNSNK